ncbi:MAG: hypothetical protein LBD22_03395 [Spirochaetaceae bacterium]|jgi:hypothetical protein|nr:hypothetical protein [Spirochaetaceae bacterium]
MTEIDLKTILINYSDCNNSAYIERDAFFKELTTQALYKSQKDRKWEVWTKRARERFDAELNMLIESGDCSIQKNNGAEYIYMPSFFIERVRSVWSTIEDQEKNIFPGDKKIKIDPPPELLRPVSDHDFIKLLRNPQHEDLPIIQLNFSGNLGSTYFLASFIESRLLDAAISKVRVCLLSKDNRGYCLTRIRSIFPDRFMQANIILDLIVKNPIGCITHMRSGNDGSFLVWIKLCEFIKELYQTDTTAPTEADFAVLQGATIIEVYNNYYSELAAKENEKENLLAELYTKLNDPPYFWTFTEIYKIVGKNGKPVIESIPHEAITDYILKRTYDTGNSAALPPLLVFYDEFKEKCFAKKETVLSAFSALITTSRKTVADKIRTRWFKILKQYRIDNAMRSDMMFETLLIRVIKQIRPFVIILYQDTKLRLLRKEFSSDAADAAFNDKFFMGSELKSLTALYEIDRRNIMKDVKLSLPFWYSMPLLVALIRFFKGININEESEEDE